MGANEYTFRIGNKAAETWTEEGVQDLFDQMYSNAKTNESLLCFNDVCKSVGYRFSHIEYFIKKFPVFENYKIDIQQELISRINKGALVGDFVPAPSIWRFKQLGERDESTHNLKNNGGSFNDVSSLSTDELIARANAVKKLNESPS